MRDPQVTSPALRHFRLSRRTFLRGVGVTMALPWMESIPAWGTEPLKEGVPAPIPKRFAAIFWGNGVNGNHWWAKGSGADMELSRSLQPMEPLKAKMNVIDGLFNRSAVGVGIHPGQTGNLLSGMPLQKGAVLHGGISMDQVLANSIGQDSVQPSMVLGCEQPITGYHETNFSMAYSSHISWQSPDSPVPMEVYPSLAFDSLFENRGSRRAQSILDRVKDDASSLARRVGARDKAKLDEYLTSVREVEKRIDRMRDDRAKAVANARGREVPVVMMKRPDNGLPEDIREHMRLMCDITALAFQTDKTRVVSLLLCRDLSGLFYPFLDVRKSHHSASHDDLSDDYERITRYYCSQLAYLAGRLESMPEGEGTVLDNSCLMLLSNMWSGNPPRQHATAVADRRRPRRGIEDRTRAQLRRQGRRKPEGLQPVSFPDGEDGGDTEPLRRRRCTARGNLIPARAGKPAACIFCERRSIKLQTAIGTTDSD